MPLEEERGASARTSPVAFPPHAPSPCGRQEGSARTVEPAPATDVAGRPVGQDVASRREAGELDRVSQLGAARQLDESDVIAGEEESVRAAWPSSQTKPHLSTFGAESSAPGSPHSSNKFPGDTDGPGTTLQEPGLLVFICLLVTQIIAPGPPFLSTYCRSPVRVGQGHDHHDPFSSALHFQGFCALL